MLFIAFSAVGCSSSVRFSSDISNNSIATSRKAGEPSANTGEKLYGKASYYAEFHNGRATANGEIFDSSKLTAAHKTLPFGTVVRVTNLRNKKQVDVVINDRGPFAPGRIIDLSRAAAEQIDMIRDGVVDVQVEILSVQ